MDTRSRLDSIALANSKVACLKYAGNFRVADTLGNGLVATYGYEGAGRLDSLGYRVPGNGADLEGW